MVGVAAKLEDRSTEVAGHVNFYIKKVTEQQTHGLNSIFLSILSYSPETFPRLVVQSARQPHKKIRKSASKCYKKKRSVCRLAMQVYLNVG